MGSLKGSWTYRGQMSGLSAVSKRVKGGGSNRSSLFIVWLYESTEKSEMGKRTALGVFLIYYLTLESHDC